MDSQHQAGGGRMEDLERRLDKVEDRQSALERSRAVMDALVPDDARVHMRAAWRENLLAWRSLLDHWITQLHDEPADEKTNKGREDIPID